MDKQSYFFYLTISQSSGQIWISDRCRIMSHATGSCYYSLQTCEHPADAQTRSWEDISKSRNVTLRDTVFTVLVIPFISLSHSKIITMSSSAMSLLSHSSFYYLLSQSISPSLASSACRGGSRLEAEGFCGMPGLDQSALQWFPLFGVCVFPEKLLVCRPPPVFFLKHTHAHTNTQRCILNVNLCQSSVLAGSQSQHWIRESELLHPKIDHKTWEHNTLHPCNCDFKSRLQWQILKIVGRLVCIKGSQQTFL